MMVTDVVRAALPWLGILSIVLIIITFVPKLSTFPPALFVGPEPIIR